MRKMEWMVAAGTLAAFAGGAYSVGCVNTASDCAQLGTCETDAGTEAGTDGGTGSGGAGGGTSSSSASSSSSSSASASSSTGTGGMPVFGACEQKRFGGAQDQVARSIHVGAAGDIFLAGDFQGSLSIGGKTVTAIGNDVFVAKLNASWQATWAKSFAVPHGAVVNDAAGGVVLAGPYSTMADLGCATPLDGSTDLYVAKLDNTGTCLWAKGFSAPNAHVSLAVAASGHIALAGDSDGPMDFDPATPGPLPIAGGMSGGRDIFVVELDASGAVISTAGYGGTADDVANGVAFDAAGGTVVTGTFKSPTIDFATGQNPLKNTGTTAQAFVVRAGGSGKIWAVDFPSTGPSTGEQHPTAIGVDGTRVLVAGDFTVSLGELKTTGTALFLLGLNAATGTMVWSKAFDGAGAKTVRALATSAGTVALTGSVDGDVDFGLGKLTSKGAGGIVVAKLGAADGKALFNHAFGGGDPALFGNGVSFAGKDLFVAGSFAGQLVLDEKMTTLASIGGADVFVAKFCP